MRILPGGDPRRPRAKVAARAAILVLLAFPDLSCATKKPLPANALPELRIVGACVAARNRDAATLSFGVAVRNPGTLPAWLESVECALAIGGTILLRAAKAGPWTLEAGGEAAVPFALEIDLRDAERRVPGLSALPVAEWTLEAVATVREPGGPAAEAKATETGSFPMVREPSLRIASLRIGRDLLVTTKLYIGIRVDNPNVFPVEFRSIAHDFYGEGSYWAGGDAEGSLVVPAGASAAIELPVTMNFADVGRNLFDRVVELASIRYRLAGEGIVATGLDFLPEFRMRFDLSGVTTVVR